MKLGRSPKVETVLVAKAVAGDEFARSELFAGHRDGMTSLAQRLLHNRDDASDAVQDALLKAVRALPDFDPERPLGPWLSRICTNCCVDLARSRRRRPSSLDDQVAQLPDTGTDVEGRVRASFQRKQIIEALGRMPARYRLILYMRHFQHKDVTQIATELHKPEGTVKSWLFRARAMLRKELAVTLL